MSVKKLTHEATERGEQFWREPEHQPHIDENVGHMIRLLVYDGEILARGIEFNGTRGRVTCIYSGEVIAESNGPNVLSDLLLQVWQVTEIMPSLPPAWLRSEESRDAVRAAIVEDAPRWSGPEDADEGVELRVKAHIATDKRILEAIEEWESGENCTLCSGTIDTEWVATVERGRIKSGRDAEAPHICRDCFAATIERIRSET